MKSENLFVMLCLLALFVFVLLDLSTSGLSGSEYYADLFAVGGWMP